MGTNVGHLDLIEKNADPESVQEGSSDLDWWPPWVRLPNSPLLSRYCSERMLRSPSTRLESTCSGGSDCMARLTRGKEPARDM